MEKKNMLIGALAGAAVGAIVGSYLRTEKGRQLVSSATEGLKDFGSRATEFAGKAVKDYARKSGIPASNESMESL